MVEYLRVFRHVGFFVEVGMNAQQREFATAFAACPTVANAITLGMLLSASGDPRGQLVTMLVPIPLPRRRELILGVLKRDEMEVPPPTGRLMAGIKKHTPIL